jgi:hypothetical protein
MPVVTLKCGCTLDTDFVSEEHQPDGKPYHASLKPLPTPLPPPEAEPEAEAEDDGKGKKKRW